jgi:hypothetical protein
MIAIILSTCLVNDPTVCREQTIPLLHDISPVRCMMTAPPHVARWSEEHPQWRVVRWQCRTGSQREI